MLTSESVKFIRLLTDLTQNELAEKLRVDRSLISRIEAGDRTITPTLVRQLKEILYLKGWSESDLFLIYEVIKIRKLKHVTRKDGL
ncbi:helix-turn-helix transcriptional regulator [Priestia aryabhattai]|uniref:helix-turn-helix transcriptional regulator n=1 Tax=Priestia aryabhattai TaxID=412384 RepID=UPI003A7FFEE3